MEVSSGVENPNPTTYEEMGLATLSYVGDERFNLEESDPSDLEQEVYRCKFCSRTF